MRVNEYKERIIIFSFLFLSLFIISCASLTITPVITNNGIETDGSYTCGDDVCSITLKKLCNQQTEQKRVILRVSDFNYNARTTVEINTDSNLDTLEVYESAGGYAGDCAKEGYSYVTSFFGNNFYYKDPKFCVQKTAGGLWKYKETGLRTSAVPTGSDKELLAEGSSYKYSCTFYYTLKSISKSFIYNSNVQGDATINEEIVKSNTVLFDGQIIYEEKHYPTTCTPECNEGKIRLCINNVLVPPAEATSCTTGYVCVESKNSCNVPFIIKTELDKQVVLPNENVELIVELKSPSIDTTEYGLANIIVYVDDVIKAQGTGLYLKKSLQMLGNSNNKIKVLVTYEGITVGEKVYTVSKTANVNTEFETLLETYYVNQQITTRVFFKIGGNLLAGSSIDSIKLSIDNNEQDVDLIDSSQEAVGTFIINYIPKKAGTVTLGVKAKTVQGTVSDWAYHTVDVMIPLLKIDGETVSDWGVGTHSWHFSILDANTNQFVDGVVEESYFYLPNGNRQNVPIICNYGQCSWTYNFVEGKGAFYRYYVRVSKVGYESKTVPDFNFVIGLGGGGGTASCVYKTDCDTGNDCINGKCVPVSNPFNWSLVVWVIVILAFFGLITFFMLRGVKRRR